MTALSILAFAAMVAGIAGQFYLGALFVDAPVVIAVQAIAMVLFVWARLTFGVRSFQPAANPTAGGLVTTGPYRYIRHPIYTTACLFCWPGALASGAPLAIGCSSLITTGAVARMLAEERLLVRRYPEYVDYAKTTKRMIPFVF
jgi:protein-S-isoprenylcysteine O-methyltransferase Ste14